MAMNVPAASDRLCVTPHEDEGYLSPSEEDLSKQRGSRFLDCKAPSDLSNASKGKRKTEEDPNDIPWEKISCLPDLYLTKEHLSWDRLNPPVPYRFYDAHQLCMRQIRKAPETTYLTDNGVERQAEIVENIWLLRDPEDNGAGGDAVFGDPAAVSLIKSTKDSPEYISVERFVQDVFHLLCGRESLTFSHGPEDNFSFVRNHKVLVQGLSPGVLADISKGFLPSGKIFKRLSHVSALHFDEKLMEREGLQSNAVFTAFLKFTSDFLKLYQTSLMLEATRIKTIGLLKVFYKPFSYQLQTLEWILDLYISTDQVTLLKGLNSMMLSCETPFVADLIRSAFISCSAAYLRYISEWIFRGQLTKGFHIQRAKSAIYRDRKYWVKQFSQMDEGEVPTFLENLVNEIFQTGKSVHLLSLIRNSESGSSILSSVLHDDTSVILPSVEFEEVMELEKTWKTKMDSFFEEYSFLNAGIQGVLASSADKKAVIDFDVVEEAKQAFAVKKLEFRQTAADKKLESQRNLMKALNEQVLEKQNREKQQKEDDVLEAEKISEYIKSVDERHLQEETRLMKKHFGDDKVIDTVGVKNVKALIAASASQEMLSTLAVKDVPSPVDEPDVSDELTPIAEASAVESVGAGGGEGANLESIIQENLLEVKPSPKKSRHVVFTSDKNEDALDAKSNEDEKYEDLNPDKFNPDNLKVRDPVPYNLSLNFESIATGVLSKSLLNFTTAASASTQEADESDNEKSFRHDSFCLNLFLNQSVAIPVAAQNRMINSTLLHYFIVEKKLFQHVEALNNYLCLHNGLFGHFLTSLLIQEVKNGTLSTKKDDLPHKFGRLNQLLGEAITFSIDTAAERSDIRDNLGFTLLRESKSSNRNSIDHDNPKPERSKRLKSAYEVLNEITINYTVEWPLSILLTEDLLRNYEKLFILQMQLYRAELLLLGLSSFLKFKGSKSRQRDILHHYRYRMLHLVRTVRHYINVTVIHCAWIDLSSSFQRMDSLDKIYEGLVRHIKFVSTNCLLGKKTEGVRRLLLDQLTVIECFCEEVETYSRSVNWDSGEEIIPRRFIRLDQKFKVWEEIQKVFIQVFFKLANRGTYHNLSYFLQLFNFNGYFENNLE